MQFNHIMQAAPHPHYNWLQLASLRNARRRKALLFRSVRSAAERITPMRPLPEQSLAPLKAVA